MNALTGAGVLAENKLFATLDTTTRKAELPDGGSEVLFTDTVGFINKLPHNLIQAFRATLEELKYADVLVHVVDSSAEHHREQMETVYETLKSLDCMDKPIITALNKADLGAGFRTDPVAKHTLKISAQTGENIHALLQTVENVLISLHQKITILLPYSQGALLSQIYSQCKIISAENREDGTLLTFHATAEIAGKVTPL
jgi:GTP-binding protein HflX